MLYLREENEKEINERVEPSFCIFHFVFIFKFFFNFHIVSSIPVKKILLSIWVFPAKTELFN